MKRRKCCLFIGNSRWHWAIEENKLWEYSDCSPGFDQIKSDELNLLKWGAAGTVPIHSFFNPINQLLTQNIPLSNLPNWIGVDRALASWAAWTKAREEGIADKGLLVADAGTVLSVTKITSQGEFEGGLLVPGFRLQQIAMAEGTAKLPLPPIHSTDLPSKIFPSSTNEAIIQGCFQSLKSTLLEAQHETKLPLWLCGGDSTLLFKELEKKNIDIRLEPNLVLEGMIKIAKSN